MSHKAVLPELPQNYRTIVTAEPLMLRDFATAQEPAFCSVCEAARDICPPLEVTLVRIIVGEAFAARIIIKVRG